MQITIDLPDNLPLTEADVRLEIAIVLYQQHSLNHDEPLNSLQCLWTTSTN